MAIKPVAIRGGLDLMTPVTAVSPGTLSDCLNYERGIREGQTRIDGFQRHDGQYRPNEYQVVRLTVDFLPEPVEAPYDALIGGTIFGLGSGTGRIVASAVGGPTSWFYYALMPGNAEIINFTSTFEMQVVGGGSEIAIRTDGGGFPVDIVSGAFLPSDVLNAVLALLSSDIRTTTTPVPGAAGTDIILSFWLKNRLYVGRDLPRVYFSGGMYSDANEGQFYTIGASEYEILAVTQMEGGSGFLTLSPVAGSGTNVTPIGSPVAFTITGTPPDCDVLAPYNEDDSGFVLGISNGTDPCVWSVVDDSLANSSLIDADNPNLIQQQTNAALWKASTAGWTMVDTHREMLFSDGTSDLANFIRDATLEGAELQETAFEFPTASTINGASTTGINANDGTSTPLSGNSGDIIVGQGFDFSDIPATAIIRGIEVTLDRQSNTANAAKDSTVTLIGVVGGAENKARVGVWPNVSAVATYGSNADLWGNQAISVTDLQAADFGVMVIVDRNSAGTATVGGLDYIAVKVYYIERDTPAYVWDGTTDQEITIQHVQVLGGSILEDDTSGANDAYGYLTIDAPKNANKTRIINVGDEVRSAPAGGGDLLALVAARDVPIWFPGQDDIDNNNSQYKAEVTNFYASDQLDAAYIVCGVGPCTAFDGERTIRIRTDLPQQDDSPRHVSRHGEKLALAFYGGVMVQSQATNPFEMSAERGALYTPTGDRITGLRGRVGDELLIPCESTLQFYTGYTSTTGMRQLITRTRGMLEYTDADIGIVLGCDGLGIFDIRTAYNFGPAERNYLSYPVAPWLQPRLQATDNAGQPSIRPLMAVARRAKNQYRLYFADAYVLTMTATEPPEFTIQRYVSKGKNEQPLAIRTICTGIDASGRERIFASFRGAKEGFMFELDSGRSFDGDAIDAFLQLNPISHSQGAPAAKGKADVLFMYGVGYGYANLTTSRDANYVLPDPANSLPLTMGATDAPATMIPQPFRGSVDFPIDGNDVIHRFDSSTAIEGPHTLQYSNLYAEDRGASRGYTGK